VDFEKFFDTNRFEEMAREYSKKYNTASVLSKDKIDEGLEENVKGAFSKAFCLFYMLEKNMQGEKSIPREVGMKIKQMCGDMGDFLKRYFGDENDLVSFEKCGVITNKSCVFALLDMTKAFFDIFESLGQEDREGEANICRELKMILFGILDVVKKFYVHI